MGISCITYRNTVTVTGNIIYSPGVTLLTESNCYSNTCYAVTPEAKSEQRLLRQGAEKCYARGIQVLRQGGQSEFLGKTKREL